MRFLVFSLVNVMLLIAGCNREEATQEAVNKPLEQKQSAVLAPAISTLNDAKALEGTLQLQAEQQRREIDAAAQ